MIQTVENARMEVQNVLENMSQEAKGYLRFFFCSKPQVIK